MSNNAAIKQLMEAAGFAHDVSFNGRDRWSHKTLGITALREDWMNDAHWEKRCKEKIAEAGRLLLFEDLPLGARFRVVSGTSASIWVKIGTKGSTVAAVEWMGLKPKDKDRVKPTLGGDLFAFNPTVEPFEPFDELTLSEQRELLKTPGAWEGLADWHDNQSAMAEAQDYVQCSKYSDARAKDFRARAQKIRKEWENG